MSAPSRARLIHLLIEERAKVLALCNIYDQGRKSTVSPSDRSRDQARREIEEEVLRPKGGESNMAAKKSKGKPKPRPC